MSGDASQHEKVAPTRLPLELLHDCLKLPQLLSTSVIDLGTGTY
jgi:hypothetical protein